MDENEAPPHAHVRWSAYHTYVARFVRRRGSNLFTVRFFDNPGDLITNSMEIASERDVEEVVTNQHSIVLN